MAVKIKLKRLGKIRQPYYRIVVADARTKRDGRAIEEIGKYHPKEEPSLIEVDSERVQYWLGVGAQPTEPVLSILKVTGDWQRFKGEAGATGTLKQAEPKADRKAVFEAAVKEAMSEAEGAATTPKGKGRRKKADDKTDKTDKTEKAEKSDKTEAKAKVKSDDKAKADTKADDKGAEAKTKAKAEAKPKAKAKADDKSETTAKSDKPKAKAKDKAAESAEPKGGA